MVVLGFEAVIMVVLRFEGRHGEVAGQAFACHRITQVMQ